jgi:hypothetical protein
MIARLACTAALVAAALSLGPADAEEAAPERRLLSDKVNVSLGGFVVDFNTDAQAGTNLVGGLVQFEDDLALESDSSTVRLDGFYRFGPKHSIDFGYFSLNRTGLTVLDKQVEWNDVIYDLGAQISSGFDVDLFRVTYRYSFVNDGRTEAGFTAGLSTYDFSAVVDGEATVDDGSGGQTIQRVRAEEAVLAPIPAIGVFIVHAFSPKWILRIDAGVFDLESGDYSGRVVDSRIMIDYYFTRHVGIGAGKSTTDMDFRAEGTDGFAVEYKQDGLLAYVSVVF